MSINEAHARIVETLTLSSPLLSEAASLLTETSVPVAGLPTLEDAKARPNANLVLRADGVHLADQVSGHVAVVSQAAPDVASLAPNFAVAAANA